MNTGEELVRAYLQYIKGCEFVQTNLYTPEVQGEIDVVGIDLNKKTVYVCEVAIHLQTGLQYTKDRRPNNVSKLIEKFSKDIEYAKKYFPDYKRIYMLWTPVVRSQKDSAKYNQMKDLKDIQKSIKIKYKENIEMVINQRFLECLTELKDFARKETSEIKSPILRLFQIEEVTKDHIKKLR